MIPDAARFYRGRRHPGAATAAVWWESPEPPYRGPLSPGRSLQLRNHSPTGFEWGYLGSGPAQLALAILIDYTGDEDLALARYQTFKAEIVAHFQDEWVLHGQAIDTWLKGKETAS